MVNINFKNTTTHSGTNFLFIPIDYVTFNFIDDDLAPEKISYDFDFDFSSKIFNILKGQNNIFNSIWCDPNTSISSGRIYIGSEKDLTIIKLENGQARVEDYFSKIVVGSTNETLEKEDIVDITIN